MENPSVIKWAIVTLLGFGIHAGLFMLAPAKQAAVREPDSLLLDLNILADSPSVDGDPNLTVEELVEEIEKQQEVIEQETEKEEERLEELEELLQEELEDFELSDEVIEQEKELEDHRKEQERLTELKRIEDARKQREKERERERLAEIKKQKDAEAKRKRDLAKRSTPTPTPTPTPKPKPRTTRTPSNPANDQARKDAAEAKKRAQLAGKKVSGAYPKRRTEPSYPRSLQKKGVEGKVKVKVHISTSGKVSNAYVVSSSGHSDFDNNAVKAAKKWRYETAKNGLGQPIEDTKIETIIFKLR